MLQTEVGDRVIYQDWLGVVEEIFEEGTLEVQGLFLASLSSVISPSRTTYIRVLILIIFSDILATGQTWKVADMGAMLDHGRRADELYPDVSTLPPLPQTGWFSSSAPRDPSKEIVVEVKATVVSIGWMAINQKVVFFFFLHIRLVFTVIGGRSHR